MIRLKRVYELPEKTDGFRILVDRLWPRGVSKQKADLGIWYKDIAPSTELRKWFAHDPDKWPEFKRRYISELRENREALDRLKEIIRKEKNVTFVYAARDTVHNEAVVLKEVL